MKINIAQIMPMMFNMMADFRLHICAIDKPITPRIRPKMMLCMGIHIDKIPSTKLAV